MLLPLFVVLALLGSTLGLTREQIEDKYVYYAALDTDPAEVVLAGVACHEEWDSIVKDAYRRPCEGLPSDTVVLFPLGWSGGPVRVAYLVRHEVEHLLRGPDGPPEDLWNEAATTAAGCAASWDPGYCY